MMSLTLYTPISECIFSTLFSIYFLMCWQGEFVEQSRGSSVDVLYSIYVYINSASLPFMIRCMITSGNGDDTC